MNGISFLADTNFLIYLLEGNEQAAKFSEYSFAISSVTEIELLGKFSISEREKKVIRSLLNACMLFELNEKVKEKAIELKQKMKIKLPDAVIAATALCHGLTLVTANKAFSKIKDLDIILLEV